jgi:serine/threonine protein kinase
MLSSAVAGLTPTPSSSSKNTVGSGGVHITGPTSDQSGELLNPFFARMVWQEMLEAVDHIHQNRIVHGDLKPANFVFVKGHLKLIDFGIAKAFSNDTTNIYRESQIGTVNYMAPEAIAPYSVDSSESTQGENEHEGMSMRLGRASDIWSLGCILYQMLYGRPPFASLTTIQKLHAIPNPNYRIQFPENDGQVSVLLCFIFITLTTVDSVKLLPFWRK